MPCYEPLRAGLVETPKGKRVIFSEKEFIKYPKRKALSLACGRCIGCRIERARQWAVRLSHENALHEESCFLTLTYNDENLPSSGSIDVPTCQKFLKRLRAKLYPKKIRHFLVGEYGEKMERPHYHAIIFGHSFPDKVLVKESHSKHGRVYNVYRSDLLDEVWKHGYCWIGSVTFDSASYVAKYCTKKITGKKAKLHYKGREPEFCIMSRGGRKAGGIGHGWIKEFSSDVYPWDEIIANGRPARPPRYYDRVVEASDPEVIKELKEKREAKAEEVEEIVLRSGARVKVAPGCNARRLLVRKEVAEAKEKMKRRKIHE